MRMKKKSKATGAKATSKATSRPAKRPKGAAVARKSASGRTGTAPPARGAVASADKSTIRRLRAQLARAQARIEELQATAETDFLLDILNRRGFERELTRAIAFIKRYHA